MIINWNLWLWNGKWCQNMVLLSIEIKSYYIGVCDGGYVIIWNTAVNIGSSFKKLGIRSPIKTLNSEWISLFRTLHMKQSDPLDHCAIVHNYITLGILHKAINVPFRITLRFALLSDVFISKKYLVPIRIF